MKKNKAILIGDITNPPYHPLKNVENEIREIFREKYRITSTENYEYLKYKTLVNFDICISYADCWNNKLSRDMIAGLLQFTSAGGGLLVIHNGISLQNNFEFTLLVGAKFTGHPEARELSFKISEPGHPVMNGIKDFMLFEEPYQYDFCNMHDRKILMEYELEGKTIPCAWCIEYGLGKVIYLMPGHDAAAFKNPVFRNILFNSGIWICR